MKKILLKVLVFIVVFITTIFTVAKIMNKGHSNLTMEMASATLPVITMGGQGYEYNRLFGYTKACDSSMMWRNITVLSENRETSLTVDTYGNSINSIGFEVRSCDAKRLIEKTDVTNLSVSGGKISANVVLKDLIEKGKEYNLIFVLDVEGTGEVRYYTKVIWSDDTHLEEKLDFVMDFHNRTFDKEEAKEITKYLETNSKLEKNESFHKVNIHSSFKQVTWGDLSIVKTVKPTINISAVASQTASFILEYRVATVGEKNVDSYFVTEYYRVKYTSDRMYLLDFERTMTQLPDVENMCSNDKIAIGIADENVNMVENEDGSVVAFEVAGKLFSYNASTNKIATLYGYYDNLNQDERAYNNQHGIKILDVDESGNVWFAVYGYINRGIYEGRVGLQLYMFDSGLNTIEQLLYVDYDKDYSILKTDIDKLLFMNRDQEAYFYLDGRVYYADLLENTYSTIIEVEGDNSLQVAENSKIICWQSGSDMYSGTELNIKNLSSGSEKVIKVSGSEAIMPLGFMDEDVIYGIANKEDITKEITGSVLFPMNKICICNTEGKILKEYSNEGLYVVDCSIVDNQITLKRVKKDANGLFLDATDDHITNNAEMVEGRNVVASADIDIFERYVQIKTKSVIDTKGLKLLTPKEVVHEGGRELEIDRASQQSSFYVFGAYGVDDVFFSPSNAIKRATECAGTVVDSNGELIWIKGNRVPRNQIMAITEKEIADQESSMSVCLNTILEYEGIVRNTGYLLERGDSALEILESALEDCQVLDLSGCSLDAVLFYVNRDLPVLVTLSNGDAVLVTGFNEFNVVIMDPVRGELYKKGINDATEWFEENGNHFVTYIRVQD